MLLEIGRVKIMSLKNGNFHITLMTLLESPYQEVRYNCAGVIGHLAINGGCGLVLSEIHI